MKSHVQITVAEILAATSAFAGGFTSSGFLKLPEEAGIGPMSAVAVDRSNGRIYVLHRGTTPLLRFREDGTYERGWGVGAFKLPHGLRIAKDGSVWITDNTANTVQRF